MTGVLVSVLVAVNSAHAQATKPAIKVTKAAPPAARTTPTPTGPSTLSGVYTVEQANRGKNVYFGVCRNCHSPESHTGAVFAKFWKGKQLSELYEYVATRMPKSEPGSLAPEEVADVVAYLLRMNTMPVGKEELYPDADSLKKFRIEVKARSGTSTAKGTKP
jgi:mono/diheme cytochrome c family protein